MLTSKSYLACIHNPMVWVLPPLKENFVGNLEIGSILSSSRVLLGIESYFEPYVDLNIISNRWAALHIS
jgi:hypothetical protein